MVGETPATAGSRSPWERPTENSPLPAVTFASGCEGRAYHDRNGGKCALTDLGLTSWRWGRVALPEQEVVFSVPEGEGPSTLIVVERDGTGVASRHRWFAVARPCTILVRAAMAATDRAAHGTRGFSLSNSTASSMTRRSISGASCAEFLGGVVGCGIAEHVLVDRIDASWMRPLVQMRIDRGPASSMWLPLFNGPRARVAS